MMLSSFYRLKSLRTMSRSDRGSAIPRPLCEAFEDRRLLSFAPAASYPVGANPQAVVTADFNNDGRLDLATANAGDNSVSVLLGNTDGTFQPALNSATGLNPEHMAVGDFNNDGNLDLATANNPSSPWGYENDISMLMGAGDGTFQAHHVDTDGWEVLSLAAGDFNGDGLDDLVYSGTDWSDSGYPFVAVRLSNDWWTYTQYIPSATSLAVADLNGDGHLDVAGAAVGVRVYLGNGDGTLSYTEGQSEFATASYPQSVAVGDFTGDGIPDLAAAGATDVAILPGFGDGTFGSFILQNTNNSQQTSVAAADFNGDGKLDIVATDAGERTLTALLGLGNGMLSLVGDHPVGPSPVAVAVGDFNGNGRPDAVAANAGSNTVSVLLNDGTWSSPPPSPSVSVSDAAAVTEGNTGTVNATFTVSLSSPSAGDVTVQYTTANLTAIAGSDYAAAAGTVTIPAGQTSATFAVAVMGDRLAEATETFAVNLIAPTNATIADGQGLGTILDNEPRISINDVSKAEGNSKTTTFTFTVRLSAAYDQAVTVNYATVAGGTATAGTDYTSKAGTLTFAPGETSRTISIVVKGDKQKESNETFFLDLTGVSSNALSSDVRGIGTILDDDRR